MLILPTFVVKVLLEIVGLQSIVTNIWFIGGLARNSVHVTANWCLLDSYNHDLTNNQVVNITCHASHILHHIFHMYL